MLLEERYVNFLCENDLTQGQFLLLYLFYKNRKDLIIKYKTTFPAEDGSMIGKYWIKDLLDKNWLHKDNNGYTITLKFRNAFCNKFDAAEELLRNYPSTIEIEGKILPLTAIDVVDLANLYSDKILDTQEEHIEILKDIKYGIENRLINLSIKKFVQSTYWISIREKRIATTGNEEPLTQHNSFG